MVLAENPHGECEKLDGSAGCVFTIHSNCCRATKGYALGVCAVWCRWKRSAVTQCLLNTDEPLTVSPVCFTLRHTINWSC